MTPRQPDKGPLRALLSPRAGFARARLGLLASLALLAVGAWAVTIFHASGTGMPMGIAAEQSGEPMAGMAGMDEMAGMDMDGRSAPSWSLAGALVFTAIWTIMMAGMMLPAAAPMIVIFASAQARRAPGSAIPTWIFVSGYLFVWAAAGLVAYGAVEIGSGIATSLAPAERATYAPIALGITLVAAGLYQFTSLKRVCLSHCRSPFAFVARHWRDGRGGALAMGLRHGVLCLGCCWALFAVLVAAGVMSMPWMILLTLIVVAEKVLPIGPRVATAAGLMLVVLGAAVAMMIVPMSWVA
jgi:predicted metal-binding membrane protein